MKPANRTGLSGRSDTLGGWIERCGHGVSVAALLLVIAPARIVAGESPRMTGLVVQARALEHGEGVARDPLRASRLYCEAARGGDAEAQYSLGWMHANGRGVPRDDAIAAYFFSLAAAQGHQSARQMLRFVGPAAVQAPPCMAQDAPLQLAPALSPR